MHKTARPTRVIVALVLGRALLAVGPDTLAAAPAPLAAAVEGGRRARLAPAVRVGAALGSAGVLLSLLAGVSRTTLSMARRGSCREFSMLFTRPITVPTVPRPRPRWLAGVGVAGCALLARTLPVVAVTGRTVLLAAGSLVWLLICRRAGGFPVRPRGRRSRR